MTATLSAPVDAADHQKGPDTAYAERLGLASSGAVGEGARRHQARVERDLHSGQAGGVPGTPTFFINGVQYEDAVDLESMTLAIAHLQ